MKRVGERLDIKRVAIVTAPVVLAASLVGGCSKNSTLERCISVPLSATSDQNIEAFRNNDNGLKALGMAAVQTYLLTNNDGQSPKQLINSYPGWKSTYAEGIQLLAEQAETTGVLQNGVYVENNEDRIGLLLSINDFGDLSKGGTIAHYPNGTLIHQLQTQQPSIDNGDIIEIACGSGDSQPMRILGNLTTGESAKL